MITNLHQMRYMGVVGAAGCSKQGGWASQEQLAAFFDPSLPGAASCFLEPSPAGSSWLLKTGSATGSRRGLSLSTSPLIGAPFRISVRIVPKQRAHRERDGLERFWVNDFSTLRRHDRDVACVAVA